MIKPSRQLRKQINHALGDEHVFLRKNAETGQRIKEGLESPFGAALMLALAGIEESSQNRLNQTSPWRVLKMIQFQSELKVARWIRMRLYQYVYNSETYLQQIKEMTDGED